MTTSEPSVPKPKEARDFIRQTVEEDIRSGRFEGRVHTRFPPEPNGYLHIGHAKAICLNFGLAEEAGGLCNLRFDDTNPAKEDEEFVASIREDVRWLGFDWGEREYNASDYFEQLHAYAVALIERGAAYVDSLSAEEVRAHRGTLTAPGRESPHRSRTVAENLDLFARMRAGEFRDGEHVLRAKIDMASPNLNMRDPTLYRIRHERHHRTGDAWCIYPTYDFAHGYSDAIERITHSLCTLEFENHRPLYDWLLDRLELYHPRQIEFARLNMTHTVLSKRLLLTLVKDGHVAGWDDPRMPTLAGLRRRGCTPEAIRAFCARIGVAKYNSTVDLALFEHALREDLNRRVPRVMAVLDPLKVVIENYPDGEEERFEAVVNPEDPAAGTRQVPFSRELWIEREDFQEDPPKKFYRLAPGREVRLRYACLLTCREVVKDAAGQVVELRCTWDPDSRGGTSPDGRKVKATLHWVSARHAVDAEVRLYKPLFHAPHPDDVPDGGDWRDNLDPASLEVVSAKVEADLAASVAPGTALQFERLGYFVTDARDSAPGAPVFNRTVGLRDSYARLEQKERREPQPPAGKDAGQGAPKAGRKRRRRGKEPSGGAAGDASAATD